LKEPDTQFGSTMDTLVVRMPSQPAPKVWQPWVTLDDKPGRILDVFHRIPV